MIIVSFEQGIAMRAFSDSVIRNPTKTFFEVREWAIAHNEVEEVVVKKKRQLAFKAT